MTFHREFLQPKYSTQKSFGYKAEVIRTGQVHRLYSYGTHVATVDRSTGEATIHEFASATTTRHIKEFLKQHGFVAESKEQMDRDYGNWEK